jgi:phosphopantothenoylcysteine decarboxylase/phosphopantothenate--cysteine ligase
VESAEDMSREVLTRARTQDVVVMAAAVADFRPASVSPSKVKRSGNLTIELEATDDIARAAAGAAPRAIHVGFALESGDLEGGAKSKLERKGIDLVVANLISSEHNPFGSDHNTVSFVTRDTVTRLPPMPKRDVARRLWDIVESMLAERSATAEE